MRDGVDGDLVAGLDDGDGLLSAPQIAPVNRFRSARDRRLARRCLAHQPGRRGTVRRGIGIFYTGGAGPPDLRWRIGARRGESAAQEVALIRIDSAETKELVDEIEIGRARRLRGLVRVIVSVMRDDFVEWCHAGASWSQKA